MDEPETRACRKCGQEKPAAEFAGRNGQVRHNCRECRRANRKTRLRDTAGQVNQLAEIKHREIEEHRELVVLEGIRQAGLRALETYLFTPGSKVPHAAEALEEATIALGGVGQIWSYVGSLLYGSETAKRDKIKLLQMYQQLLLKTTEVGGAKKPADILSDEDIKQERERLTIELMHRQGIPIHGNGSLHSTASPTA